MVALFVWLLVILYLAYCLFYGGVDVGMVE